MTRVEFGKTLVYEQSHSTYSVKGSNDPLLIIDEIARRAINKDLKSFEGEVTLSRVNLTDKHLMEIFREVSFEKITKLDLSHNNLTADGVVSLKNMFGSKIDTFHLVLDGNEIGLEGIKPLIDLCNEISLIVGASNIGVNLSDMAKESDKITNPFSSLLFQPKSS